MSRTLSLVILPSLLLGLLPSSFAQLPSAPVPLELDGEARPVQLPAYADFKDPQCDSDGSVYLRHESDDDNSWIMAKIASDGSAQQTQLADVPGFGDRHTFTLAVADGGAVHEIVRAWKQNGPATPLVYYLQFDSDGSFRSSQVFEKELVASQLLPLPSGDFFAGGVLIKKVPGSTDVEEVPIAGVFDSDTHLRSKLGGTQASKVVKIAKKNTDSNSDSDEDALAQGGIVRLGDDGNIYVLFTERHAKVRVYRQSGEFLYQLNLQQPFEEGLMTGLWISGGRMLVTYEGEADDPKDSFTYILYDARTGELIRAYRPQFSGTVACFENGQSTTILLKNNISGTLAIGTADLR
jgi:hypothetical protein